MNILLTGMSSSQCSPKANDRNLSFSGVLNKMLTDLGHNVDWVAPDLSWSKKDLEKYDAIFVGIIPPTSISANKAYGALNIVQLMWNSDKLRLVVDWPQQWLLGPSFNSIVANPEQLVKPFYSQRTQYQMAKAVLEDLAKACWFLANSPWPTTIYPALPWTSEQSVIDNLPSGAATNLYGLNYDSSLLEALPDPQKFDTREDYWLVDKPSDWTKSVAKGLTNPVNMLKASKKETDYEALVAMANATGLLVSPQRRQGGVWWTYSIVQAVATLTPTVTEWRETSVLGPSWSQIATTVEAMSVDDRHLLASEQRRSYIDALPTKEEALSLLTKALKA